MQREIQRILIVRTDRIGDVILTLPMARVLKQHFPQSSVSMLIREYTAELVREDPNVDEILYDDRSGNQVSVWNLVRLLREKKFDVVFHTHPRVRLAVITWLAGIPVRVGTGYRWYSFLFNRRVYEHRKTAQLHELEYNLNLLKAVGCPLGDQDSVPSLKVRDADTERVTRMLRNKGVATYEKIVILHPGSGGSARDWSVENFALLGKRISGMPDVKVVVTGGAGEADLVKRVQTISGPSSVALCNELNLGEYAALAKMASVFVANSTGTIHIAAAVGTPVIGLYPQLVPLSAARWGPYTERNVIFSPKGKSPECTLCTGEKGTECDCMNSIPVDDVFEAVSRIVLGEQLPSSASLSDKHMLQGDRL